MSNSPSSLPPNPILANKYSSLVSSSDPIAKKIVSDVTTMYNNAIIFNNETDVTKLDSAVLIIQDTFNEFINLATPCSSISNTDKCSTTTCKFVSDIESLYIDIFVLLQTLPAYSDRSKAEYKYLPFFMVYYFSNMVINNPNNQNKLALPNVEYYLCSGTKYIPAGLSPSMTAAYNNLKSKMTKQQSATVVRQSSNNSINFLSQILLPSFVFIVLVLLYIRHVRMASDD